MTALIYIRLSRETAESASIDTQRNAARLWLTQNGYDPADSVEYVDSGVSGAKPLEERADMRRLMQDINQRRAQGETSFIIIAWKLDRYARSVSEFLRLVAWGEERGARLATTDNTINTVTPTGRMVAVVLAALAEWERSLITGRVVAGQATRRTQGRWVTGAAPYGYRIERRDGAAYLAIDEAEAAKIRAAVAKLLTDGTVTGTARMLDIGERQWRRMLTRQDALRGRLQHNGQLVLSEDGVTPVQFADPIINAAEAKAIRERLHALAVGEERAPRQATPLCTAGLATCWKCGKNLNGGKRRDGILRYRCKQGCSTIKAAALDDRVKAEFLARWGAFPEHTVRLEGGNDLTDQMIEAQEQAERLTARMATAGPLMLASLEKHAADLEAAYASLRAAHDPEVREVLVPTGRTLEGAWDAADRAGRTQLLKDMGLHVVLLDKTHADRLAITWAVGGDDQELVEMLGDLDAKGAA